MMGPANQHIVFGPFDHEVLGRCIGLNLFSSSSPICEHDCAFCDLNKEFFNPSGALPEPYEVVEQLIEFLQLKGETSSRFDCIIITGGGDPTNHPKFAEIINDVILVRDLISTETRIGVFTNGEGLHHTKVIASLQRVDLCILKIDPSIPQQKAPNKRSVDMEMASNIADLSSLRTKLILQSCFIDQSSDSTNQKNSWENEVDTIHQFKPTKAFLCSSKKDVHSTQIPFLSPEQLEAVRTKLAEENIPAFIL